MKGTRGSYVFDQLSAAANKLRRVESGFGGHGRLTDNELYKFVEINVLLGKINARHHKAVKDFNYANTINQRSRGN